MPYVETLIQTSCTQKKRRDIMFYVRIDRPINLKGDNQVLYSKINQKYGIKYGIHLVKSGFICGERGDARYRDFYPMFENLPTFRGHWDENSPVNNVDGKDVIAMDLFLDNGLLLERGVFMVLHEVNKLSDDENGKYLLLCSDGDFYYQVITE